MKRLKLDEVCDILNGYAFKSSKYSNKGYRIIRITNVQKGIIVDESPKYYSDKDMVGLERYKLFENDILLSLTGNVGRVGIMNNSLLPAALNQRVACLRLKNDDVCYEYLFYYLNSDEFENLCIENANGIAQKNLSTSFLKTVSIPIPPLDIQKKIIEVLDKSQELVDKRKEQITALSKLKQSIFYDMFGDPEDYSNNSKRLKIEDLFRVQTGSTPSRKENKYWENGNIPWIKTTQLQNDLILTVDEYVTEQAVNERNLKLFPENTILIAMYGQGKTRGRTGLLRFPATTNQACAALIPKKEINLSFIWMQLILRYEALRDLGRGGNQPNLNLSLIRGFDVLFPDENKQKKYSEITSEIDTTLNLVKHSLEEMDTLYNSLMQQAFKGERF